MKASRDPSIIGSYSQRLGKAGLDFGSAVISSRKASWRAVVVLLGDLSSRRGSLRVVKVQQA